MVRAIYCWKPISRRPTGRPKTRWEDDVRKDIQKSKVPNWKTLVQDRRRWKDLVEKAKTLHKELYSHNKKRRRRGTLRTLPNLFDQSGFESQKAFQPNLLNVLLYVMFVCK